MKILFASDMSFNYLEELPSAAKAQSTMAEAAEEFKKADFSVVNLENIFGNREDYTPLAKSGPNLISDKCFLEYINAIKPTVVNMANNHSKDYGEEALLDTIKLVKDSGYTVIGAGENTEKAYEAAVLEKDGIKCAIIGICENEFGVADNNTSGTAGYNLSRASKAIKKAIDSNQLPIIYFHGGNEHNPFPSPSKTELYRHFIDIGAKAVIAMHTHCPQGYEIYNQCPIIYSMGNFFFPKGSTLVNKAWFYGYMTLLTVSCSSVELKIIPYEFDFNKISILKGEKLNKFNEYLNFISEEIKKPEKIQSYFDSWCMDIGIVYSQALSFDSEKFADYTPKQIANLKNVFSCEAHNELVTNTLKVIYEQRVEEALKGLEKLKKLQNMEL